MPKKEKLPKEKKPPKQAKHEKQQKKRKGRSVQDFIGVKTFTKYGLMTQKGELLFYLVSPTNISVLSYVNIEIKIRHLMMVLSSIPDIEITCTDSSECFDDNKAYLLKLILTNIRESGKAIICLDPESEYEELCNALGGCYIDFMSGEYTINPLEPKAWTDSVEDIDATTPEAFKKVTRLSQHIAFLKDFFRSYKDFSDTQIDTIEILLSKLYARFGITDATDYSTKKPTDFPIMEDFYKLCEEEFYSYDKQRKYLYTEDTLQDVCLGIHSMCVGAESKYFNGHTNITDSHFLVFGVKGLMDTNKRLKDAMLFNILSFMSNQLLGQGKTAASIDELYLFLTNMTAIEYIRNAMKRVRKKDSSIILASQNIEDFLIPSIREFTKPLFSIPTHQFLFNAGQINPKEYMDALQVEPSEFELIKYPERGTCLFRCGNERYLLQVIAPDYKAALFGKAGGR